MCLIEYPTFSTLIENFHSLLVRVVSTTAALKFTRGKLLVGTPDMRLGENKKKKQKTKTSYVDGCLARGKLSRYRAEELYRYDKKVECHMYRTF